MRCLKDLISEMIKRDFEMSIFASTTTEQKVLLVQFIKVRHFGVFGTIANSLMALSG